MPKSKTFYYVYKPITNILNIQLLIFWKKLEFYFNIITNNSYSIFCRVILILLYGMTWVLLISHQHNT